MSIVLQKGNAKYPFWGSSINLITGLDPLSLQTTSEATYAALLPGISNLTNRLRYYGFYCWLLDFYFQKEQKGNSAEQYKFIRRAELMIAIIMRSERKSVTQITGSDFAAKLIEDQNLKIFDLAEGADKTDNSTKVYWKYPSGAFGQYYYGAMRAISLVVAVANDDGDVIFSVTHPHAKQRVSGKQLAIAFEKSLTPEVKEIFYNNIKRGKLSVNDIPELITYFHIDSIDPTNAEWPLYVAMLLDKDDPNNEVEDTFTFHRRETILSLIESTLTNENRYDWNKLLIDAYEIKIGNSDTLTGWYAYQFNEYFQYGCGAIFWGTLMHLYEFQQEQYLPAFVDEWTKMVTKEICKNLEGIKSDNSIKQILSAVPTKKSIESIYNSIETRGDSNPQVAAAMGFVVLFKLFNDNKEQLHPLKEFMIKKQIIREGNVIDGLLLLHHNESSSLIDFVRVFLLRSIIYRHQMVAIRKMGNGSQSTHKFIIEEQYIKFIETYPPRRTSPRMNALWNLLSDLGIVDENNQLSPLYSKVLEHQ